MSDIAIPAFPKIWALGAPEIERIFVSPVEITEKIDGSQFAFGKLPTGELFMRSKGAQIYAETADKLFKPAVDYVISIEDKLDPGWTFYGETLYAKKHNVLRYDHIPLNHIMLFGAKAPDGVWLKCWKSIDHMAVVLGLNAVPFLDVANIHTIEDVKKYMDRESALGGEKVEGIVIKNYDQQSKHFYSPECYGKLVREEFKERNSGAHPKGKDKLEDFISQFKTEARWLKAVQHLREVGTLESSPRDIGKLIVEAQHDLIKEEESFIKEGLYKLFRNQFLRVSTAGLAEWYKNYLLEKAFEKKEESVG